MSIEKLKHFMLSLKLSFYILLLCININICHALPYSDIGNIIFFGDSLSDSGYYNLFPLADPRFPPGKAPTYTTYNGYVYTQYLAKDIKNIALPTYHLDNSPNIPDTMTNNTTPPNHPLPTSGTLAGFNFAAGGAQVSGSLAPTSTQQIQNYIDANPGQLNPKDVYFINIGSNDLLTPILTQTPRPALKELIVIANETTTQIIDNVLMLINKGAKRISVAGLVDFSFTPRFIERIQVDPLLKTDLASLTFMFNSFLNQKLGKLLKTKDVNILYINSELIIEKVIASISLTGSYSISGKTFNFSNYTEAACGSLSAILCPSSAPNDYFWADGIHPTSQAHEIFALEIEKLINEWH